MQPGADSTESQSAVIYFDYWNMCIRKGSKKLLDIMKDKAVSEILIVSTHKQNKWMP